MKYLCRHRNSKTAGRIAISAAAAAEVFGLTPNYLSSLFHEKTGKRFVDYLTEVRMIHAQKILDGDPDIAIKKVAQMVGYISSRHFANLFKKHTGHYPSDYKESGSVERE
jgi:two-component system response regulator YesN